MRGDWAGIVARTAAIAARRAFCLPGRFCLPELASLGSTPDLLFVPLVKGSAKMSFLIRLPVMALLFAVALFVSFLVEAWAQPDGEPLDDVAEASVVPGRSLVPAADLVQLNWTGPGDPGDFVEIVGAEGEPLEHEYRLALDDPDKPGVRAPGTPGSYLLQYVRAVDGAVLATAPLRVVPAAVSLRGADTAEAGGRYEVEWFGPDGEGDWIGFALPADGEGGAEAEDGRRPTADGNPLELGVPQAPGAYELHYVSGSDGTVLGTKPVLVTGGEASEG